MKIGLDLAEILRISKLDWRDGGGKKGREEGKGRNLTALEWINKLGGQQPWFMSKSLLTFDESSKYMQRWEPGGCTKSVNLK